VLAIKAAAHRMVFNDLYGVNFISPSAMSPASSAAGGGVVSKVRY
jgi:hypothetical protein